MGIVFKELIESRRIFLYVDDLYILSSDLQTHLETLNELFYRCRQYGLKISVKKSEFCYTKTDFLGFKLTSEGLTMSENKIKVIKNMKIPTSIKEVCRFNGTVNFFRRLIKGYANIMAPLFALTQKNAKFS